MSVPYLTVTDFGGPADAGLLVLGPSLGTSLKTTIMACQRSFAPPSSRGPSAAAAPRLGFRRLRLRLRLRPAAALGPTDAGELLGRVEAFLYTVADAAVSAAPEAGGGAKEAAGDWLSGITNSMETVLKVRLLPSLLPACGSVLA